MQLEFIGCTNAGKSTLVRGILQACREQGIDALVSNDFVLKKVRLNWVKNDMAQTLLVNLFSLCACLIHWRKNLRLYFLMMRIIFRLPSVVTWFEKLNIVRIALRNVGIYEIILRFDSDKEVILLDEGTLQIAHYLFVHVAVELNMIDLLTFIRLLPLPAVAAYIQQDEAVLIERTLARGHKRIAECSYTKVERFIRRAISTFENISKQPVIERMLIVMDSHRKITVAQDSQNDPKFDISLKIIRAGIDAIVADKSDGTMPSPRRYHYEE